MTTEEFWNGEPRVLCSYIKKYELELDDMNRQSWLIGLYVCKAVSTVVGNALASKNSIKETYFEKPLEQFNYSAVKEEKQNNVEKDHRQNVNYWAQLGKKGAV